MTRSCWPRAPLVPPVCSTRPAWAASTLLIARCLPLPANSRLGTSPATASVRAAPNARSILLPGQTATARRTQPGRSRCLGSSCRCRLTPWQQSGAWHHLSEVRRAPLGPKTALRLSHVLTHGLLLLKRTLRYRSKISWRGAVPLAAVGVLPSDRACQGHRGRGTGCCHSPSPRRSKRLSETSRRQNWRNLLAARQAFGPSGSPVPAKQRHTVKLPVVSLS